MSRALLSPIRISLLLIALVVLTPDGQIRADRSSDEAGSNGLTNAASLGSRRMPVPPPSGQLPSNLLQLPASTPSAVLVDLEQNRLYVYRRGDGGTQPAQDLFVAIGKQGIGKLREGDEKTPVGVYFPISYLPGSGLPAIYGAGAFPLDYPNHWDRRVGRTGSGIWIHGTDKDDQSLVPLSSRGCLTLLDPDFLGLADDLHLDRTPVIVAPRLRWASPSAVEGVRGEIGKALEQWRSDWESLDVERYLSHYSKDFRTPGMSRQAFAQHKRRVGAGKTLIRVGLDEVGIFEYPGEEGLFLVTFQQSYTSNNFNGQRLKHQFWRREAEGWRIVLEASA